MKSDKSQDEEDQKRELIKENLHLIDEIDTALLDAGWPPSDGIE